MEMDIKMGINRNLQLSPTVYNRLQSSMEFKAVFHHVYIRAHKDPMKKWNQLSYMATSDVIFDVLEVWLPKWCAHLHDGNFSAQRRKEETKLWMAQLAEKRIKEVAMAQA